MPMPISPLPAAPLSLAEARRLYERTDAPVDAIAERLAVSRATFYRRCHDEGWALRCARDRDWRASAPARPVEAPPAPVGEASDESAGGGRRADLVRRLEATVAREIAALDVRLDRLGLTPERDADHERTARALASLARTLRELVLIDASAAPLAAQDADDDPPPRDLDALRDALADRLDRLLASRADAGVPGDL